MNKSFIATADAPAAIGTYSQAVKVGQTTYLSGQIPLIPESMLMVEDDIEAEVRQAFSNLKAVCEAAGGSLNHLAKVNVFLTNLDHFPVVNEVMDEVAPGVDSRRAGSVFNDSDSPSTYVAPPNPFGAAATFDGLSGVQGNEPVLGPDGFPLDPLGQ